MKNSKFWKIIAVVAAMGIVLSTAACQAAVTPAPSATQAASAAPSAALTDAATAAPTATPAPTAAPDPFGKYETPVTVTYVLKGIDGVKFDSNNSPEDNFWSRGLLKDLGINMKLLWAASNSEADQKWQLTVASGDLPDILPANDQEIALYNKKGMLEDMTQAYADYASPEVKEIYGRDGGASLAGCTVDGKLLSVPQWPYDPMQFATLLWIRTDWLDNLNLKAPATMQDVLAIAKAFATQDPDKNGKNDTFGIGLNKDLLVTGRGWCFPYADGFFNGYHSYPTEFIKDSSGKLVYGGIQPEAKAALLALQQLYKDGAIDKEFGVKDSQKLVDDVTAGKLGMYYCPDWSPEYPIVFNIEKDPKAKWQPFALPSVDAQPTLAGAGPAKPGDHIAFKVGTKHPEALIKILNYTTKEIYFDKQNAQIANDLKFAAPITLNPPMKNHYAWKNINEAMTTNDSSKLNGEETQRYQNIQKYLAGDKTFYGDYAQFAVKPNGVDGPHDIEQKTYVENKQFMSDAYVGPDQPTWVAKFATLDKLQKETYTKIIMGADISTFDKFATDWMSLGGEQALKEMNDWMAANGK